MPTKTTLRWLAAIGAAGSLLAATAAPATATAPAEGLAVFFPDTTVAIDGPGVQQFPVFYAAKPVVLPPGATLTVDFADLDGKVEVAEPDGPRDCTSPSPTRLVCQEPFEIELDENGLTGIFEFELTAAPGAAAGDSGTLTATFTAPGFAPASDQARVRVGEGVDLVAGPDVTTSAAPGKAITDPLTVTNASDTTIDGINILFFDDYPLLPTTRYRNCTYADGRLRSCAFDTPVGPGETFTATLPYTLRKDSFAPSHAVGERMLMTRAEFEDLADSLEKTGAGIGTPGDGPELKLVRQTSLAARGVQADVDPDNNWTHLEVTVTGRNGTDLAAAGGTLTGAAGDKVKAAIGVANNGPATIANERSGSPATLVDLVPPPGTTVVGVPERCAPLTADGADWNDEDLTGADRYRCLPDITLIAGEKELFEFTLRIDTVVPDAAGTVEVNVPCACDGSFPRDKDLNPANDKAKLVVNPTGGGAGGGEGGGLPVTGTPIGLIIGVGALLVLTGMGGYLVARRRRVRFTA